MVSNRARALLAGTILACCPAPVLAQQAPREADLTARLAALENQLRALDAEMTILRADLAAERQKNAPALPATPSTPVPAQLAVQAPARAPASSGGTTIRVGGFFKSVASFSHTSGGAIPANSTGRDFYVPSTIPIGGRSDGTDYEAHAKQTRIVVNATTPVEGHTLSGLLEMDFQTSPGAGNQRMTNAYAPGLRRGYLAFDDFLVGQEWSNFQYVAALPETTDYLGPSEGTVFVRQAQLRYTRALGKRLTLSVAAENAATVTSAKGDATLIENDSDRLPDVTARLSVRAGAGELSLAGLVRQLTIAGAANGSDDAAAWGVSFAGKLPFGPGGRHDLRFMVTRGSGIGRYVGLNLAPDAMLVTTASALRLEPVDVTAGFAALRLGWSGTLRSTVMGSYQKIGFPNGLATPTATDRAWSATANLFYSPVKPLDLGIEMRHGERGLVSEDSGTLDRVEMIARYNF